MINSFILFCEANRFEINDNRLKLVQNLDNFLRPKKNFFDFIFNRDRKLCFYLYGNIGIGKTMIIDFACNQLNRKVLRSHFNEFMINFHDFRHKNKRDNSIAKFVVSLKKNYQLVFLDEFQVTNIVDAMILGKLFEEIFSQKIKVILSTNIKLENLYKNGLQREQFIPFLDLLKENSLQEELVLEDDYRKLNNERRHRIFIPLNEKTLFNINKEFRILTKNYKKEEKLINTKGRHLKITNYFNGIIRIKFKDLCDINSGAEDYLNLAKLSKHLFIEEIPSFDDYNSNQQLRFITLIDILYEKKVKLTLSMVKNLEEISSSKKHSEIFKRTVSRLYEMTETKNF